MFTVNMADEQEENTPKLRPAATKKKHYTHPVGEVKCRIYSNAAQNLALPEIDENIADSDEDEDLYDEPVSKKKRQPYKKTARKKKSNNPVYLDSDEEDISCYGTPKKAPSVSSLDSPCSPPPPLDLASQLMQYDQETSKVLRSINVALTNVRCIQSEVSSQSDDGFSPARRIPGGTIAVIDVDSPPAPRIRSTITVKVRSRAGIKRFPLQMTDTFSSIIDEIASQEGVRRDCVRLTRNGQDVGEFDTPHSMELHIADIIDCLIVEPECLIAAPEQRVEVTIQGQEKKSTMTTTILWSDSLQKLMAEYSTFCGRPQHKIRFTFDGDVIKATDTPTSLDFEEDTNTIDAIFI